MTWRPISGTVPQYERRDKELANGYYIKFYSAGTSDAIFMATDADGNGQLAKAQLNNGGYPINGSSDEFIPYVAEKYKIVLYKNATDADNDNTANAEWVVDDVEDQLDVWEIVSATPTQTGATTFTVPNDLTSTFVTGTRVRFTDTSTLYGIVISSVFTSLTTVTVTLDSGSLTGSLTEVYVSISDVTSKPISAYAAVWNIIKTGSVNVTLDSILRRWVFPENFGALGDGSNDDISALNAMIAAFHTPVSGSNANLMASYALGKPKFIMTRNYRITSPWSIGDSATNNNVIYHLDIEFFAGSQIEVSGFTDYGIKLYQLQNFTLKNMSCDRGIYIDTLKNGRIEGVWAAGFSGLKAFTLRGFIFNVNIVNIHLMQNNGNGGSSVDGFHYDETLTSVNTLFNDLILCDIKGLYTASHDTGVYIRGGSQCHISVVETEASNTASYHFQGLSRTTVSGMYVESEAAGGAVRNVFKDNEFCTFENVACGGLNNRFTLDGNKYCHFIGFSEMSRIYTENTNKYCTFEDWEFVSGIESNRTDLLWCGPAPGSGGAATDYNASTQRMKDCEFKNFRLPEGLSYRLPQIVKGSDGTNYVKDPDLSSAGVDYTTADCTVGASGVTTTSPMGYTPKKITLSGGAVGHNITFDLNTLPNDCEGHIVACFKRTEESIGATIYNEVGFIADGEDDNLGRFGTFSLMTNDDWVWVIFRFSNFQASTTTFQMYMYNNQGPTYELTFGGIKFVPGSAVNLSDTSDTST